MFSRVMERPAEERIFWTYGHNWPLSYVTAGKAHRDRIQR